MVCRRRVDGQEDERAVSRAVTLDGTRGITFAIPAEIWGCCYRRNATMQTESRVGVLTCLIPYCL